MEEVKIVRHRTHIWPVILAIVVLAIVLGYVFFAQGGPAKRQIGWNVGSGFSRTLSETGVGTAFQADLRGPA